MLTKLIYPAIHKHNLHPVSQKERGFEVQLVLVKRGCIHLCWPLFFKTKKIKTMKKLKLNIWGILAFSGIVGAFFLIIHYALQTK